MSQLLLHDEQISGTSQYGMSLLTLSYFLQLIAWRFVWLLFGRRKEVSLVCKRALVGVKFKTLLNQV
jgi:hypothetical protein